MFKKLKSTCCTLPLHACVTRYTTQARLAETARCAKNNMTSFGATKIVYYNWLIRFCGYWNFLWFYHALLWTFNFWKAFVTVKSSSFKRKSSSAPSVCNWHVFVSPRARESAFRTPGNFCLWNKEPWALESGIQLKQSGIPLTIAIRTPRSTGRGSGIQYLKSGIHGMESTIQDCLKISIIHSKSPSDYKMTPLI